MRHLLCVVIVFLAVSANHVCRSARFQKFSIPDVEFEFLKPRGFRASIPGRSDWTLTMSNMSITLALLWRRSRNTAVRISRSYRQAIPAIRGRRLCGRRNRAIAGWPLGLRDHEGNRLRWPNYPLLGVRAAWGSILLVGQSKAKEESGFKNYHDYDNDDDDYR